MHHKIQLIVFSSLDALDVITDVYLEASLGDRLEIHPFGATGDREEAVSDQLYEREAALSNCINVRYLEKKSLDNVYLPDPPTLLSMFVLISTQGHNMTFCYQKEIHTVIYQNPS